MRLSKQAGPAIPLRALLILLSLGMMLSAAACARNARTREPVGGELFTPDLENGVSIYVEEGYFAEESYFASVEEAHSVWSLSDEALREEILHLCGEIKQHRQFEKAGDLMLGSAEGFTYYPCVYLVTDAVCYRIEALNWENYSGDAWSDFPIRQELFGKPVLRVFRIDLSSAPEDEPPYRFAKDFFGADTLNSTGGAGWYSTLPQRHMDRLLELLRSVGAESAERVWPLE